MTTFLWLALDLVTKATLLLFVAMLADLILKHKPAAVRHRVWCLAFCGLLSLPLLATVLPSWKLPILPRFETVATEVGALPTPLEQPAPQNQARFESTTSSQAEPRSIPVVLDRSEAQPERLSTMHVPVTQAPQSLVGEPEPVATESRSERGFSIASVARWVSMLWLPGMLIALIPLLRSVIQNRRLRTSARSITTNPQVLEGLCRRLRIARGVDWMESDRPIVPMTWGILHPVVMFPDSWRQWSDSKQRLVLMHELSHVKRFDVAFQMIARLACALYWFHPLAWHGLRRLRIERELACDDCVLIAGAKPSEYATELLDIASRFPAVGMSTAVAMAQTSNLEQRIRSLLDSARSHLPVGPRTARLLVVLTAVIVTGVAVIEPGTVADDASPEVGTDQVSESPGEVESQDISLSGRVLDVSDSPIAGATLWVSIPSRGLFELGKTGDNGGFSVELDPDVAEAVRDRSPTWAQLIALAPRHGLDFLPMEMFADSPLQSETKRQEMQHKIDSVWGAGRFASRTLKLPPAVQPVRGRLIDLEGNPLPGVRIVVESLLNPDVELLDEAFAESSGRLARQAISAKHGQLGVSDLRRLIPPPVTRDDGTFVLDHIGQDQVAIVYFQGRGVQADKIRIVGREMAVVRVPHIFNRSSGSKDVYVGRDFTHAVGASVVIRGQVTDFDTGDAIAGAHVYVDLMYPESESVRMDLHHMKAVSDADGRFAIDGLAPLPSRLRIDPPKDQPYFIGLHSVELKPSDNEVETAVQLKRGIWIEGRVTDKTSGRPVESGVDYLALRKNPNTLDKLGLQQSQGIQRYKTDAEGRFRTLGHLGPGVLLVRVREDTAYPRSVGAETVDGYYVTTFGGDFPTYPGLLPLSNWNLIRQIDPVTEAEAKNYTIELDALQSVTGRVVAPDGEPVIPLCVQGEVAGDVFWRHHHGTHEFTVECYDGVGPRRLFFQNDDGSLVGTYVTEGESPEDIEVILQPSVTVSGRLIETETGLPAAGFGISCDDSTVGKVRLRQSGQTGRGSVKVDSDGRFEIVGLMAGVKYQMSSLNRARDFGKNDFTIDLTSAQPGDVVELGDVTGPAAEADKPTEAEVSIQNANSGSRDSAGRQVLSGVVVDDQDKPLPNAVVRIVRWLAGGDEDGETVDETRSDESGRFELSCSTDDFSAMQASSGSVVSAFVVAHKDGFGSDGVRLRNFDGDQEIRLTVPIDSAPLSGQLVDLEGRPLTGVRVKLRTFSAPKDGDLSNYIAAVQRGEPPWTAVTQLRNLPVADPRLRAEVITDSNGEFQIPGLGRNRVAHLVLEGRDVAYTSIQAATANIETLAQPLTVNPDWASDKKRTIVGNGFRLTVPPCRVVRGVVRDATTGQPMGAVGVQSWRFPGTHTIGERQIKTESRPDGSFELYGIPKGDGGEIVAIPNDDQPYFMRVIKVPDDPGMNPIKLDIELHRGVWITGRATDKMTGAPIEGARLYYLPYLDNEFASRLPEFGAGGSRNVEGTNAFQSRYLSKNDGSYRLVGLPGPAVLGIEAVGRQYRYGFGWDAIAHNESTGRADTYFNPLPPSPTWPHSVVEIDPDADAESIEVALQLDPGNTVEVVMQDPQRRPLRNVSVEGVGPRSGSKQVEGPRFDVVALGPTETRTVILRQHDRNLGTVLRVPGDANETLIATLEPLVTVRGRLIDGNGVPVSGAELLFGVAPSEDFNKRLRRLTTDEEGRFEHDSVPAGTNYNVMIESAQVGFRTIAKDLEVTAGEEIDLGTIDVTSDQRPEPVRSSARDRSNTLTATPDDVSAIDNPVVNGVDACESTDVAVELQVCLRRDPVT